MNDLIFTSYCFGDKYIKQQNTLANSIKAIYPDANLHFSNEPEKTGKPKFQESMYGFKVHLIKECLEKGFKRIIYFDTAVCLEKEVDYWFTLTDKYGFIAANDNQKLSNVTSNDCLKWCNLSRQDVSDWNLVGGSLYILDFNIPKCNEIFNLWYKMEAHGLFGKQDDLSHDRLQAHRMDETCLAIAMRLNGVLGLTHDEIRYAYEHHERKTLHGSKDPIVIKRHFK